MCYKLSLLLAHCLDILVFHFSDTAVMHCQLMCCYTSYKKYKLVSSVSF